MQLRSPGFSGDAWRARAVDEDAAGCKGAVFCGVARSAPAKPAAASRMTTVTILDMASSCSPGEVASHQWVRAILIPLADTRKAWGQRRPSAFTCVNRRWQQVVCWT